MEQVYKQTGKRPEGLLLPSPPEELLYLWEMLVRLTTPLTYAEMLAWSHLTGRRLQEWEIDLLVDLDGVRRDER